jgi:hypothetical protein
MKFDFEERRRDLFAIRQIYRDSLFWVLCMVAVFAISQTLGWTIDIYKRFWWFDIPMHYFGGFLSMALTSTFHSEHYLVSSGFRKPFMWALGIFVAWEILEYFQVIGGEPIEFWDTLKDFAMDILGALTFYSIGWVRHNWRPK